MNSAIKAGIGLAVAIAILSVATMLAGLHKSPIVGSLVFLVLAITFNVVAVFWALKQTADVNSYLQQLLNGVLIGAIGGVLIFCFSYVNLTYLFPDGLEESRVAAIEMVQGSAAPEAMKEKQLESIQNTTAVSQSVPGLIGTLVTSLISGAIIAIFKRRK